MVNGSPSPPKANEDKTVGAGISASNTGVAVSKRAEKAPPVKLASKSATSKPGLNLGSDKNRINADGSLAKMPTPAMSNVTTVLKGPNPFANGSRLAVAPTRAAEP